MTPFVIFKSFCTSPWLDDADAHRVIAIPSHKGSDWRDIQTKFFHRYPTLHLSMMQPQQVRINPLLTSPTGTTHFRPVLIDWDVRRAPRHAARVANQAISTHHLTQLVVHPRVTSLRVVSDLLSEDWVIAAYNATGVTIEDILEAIHRGLHVPLTQSEWDCISPAKRTRIETTFYARCQASREFDRTRNGGVRRMDCLLHTTVFAGMSSPMFRNNRWEVVLTLSRDFSARNRA